MFALRQEEIVLHIDVPGGIGAGGDTAAANRLLDAIEVATRHCARHCRRYGGAAWVD